MKAVKDRGASAIGRDQDAAPAFVILKPVERALDAISDELSRAQSRPAVGASIPQAERLPLLITDEHQPLSQAGNTEQLPSLHLPRSKDNMPLVGYHFDTSLRLQVLRRSTVELYSELFKIGRWVLNS